MTDRARSFDGAAALYAGIRPDYPPAALDWLLPAGAWRVLDLGAGTGKLTRQLVDRGLDVVAVEPSPAMGAQLSAYVPEAELREAAAEAIPLPDDDVDAVVVGTGLPLVRPGPGTAGDRSGAAARRPGGTAVELRRRQRGVGGRARQPHWHPVACQPPRAGRDRGGTFHRHRHRRLSRTANGWTPTPCAV
ncbi:MAG: class I SAM-dependent methyltransferase [Geodermatophilaceae bacterium]